MATMTDDPVDYRLDDQIGYLLRLANQRHTTIFQDHTLQNLTPTQFSVMVRLEAEGKSSQNRLGRLAAMDVATIKGVVDRLRERGLAVSEPDPDDRRRSVISLTDEGRALLARMRPVGLAISEQTLAPLNPAERRTLLRLIAKLT
ncbi:MarR family winged helix-turn-helix transcriptional regulator [Gemmobacter nectariphilus]|uniref:MarR family winged helix-turn-helix transcriptional regulator n=1 Tax=Gemmobacter nectariphilus TaxID=220343 RepID=UPI000481AE80|nr:MarR family winged helix-turn-helix transcriptional regulator [Gemmobacter nectariphilus]